MFQDRGEDELLIGGREVFVIAKYLPLYFKYSLGR